MVDCVFIVDSVCSQTNTIRRIHKKEVITTIFINYEFLFLSSISSAHHNQCNSQRWSLAHPLIVSASGNRCIY